VLNRYGDATRLTYHLSPGTPAMQAVWIIVAKTRYAATLIQSSRESGLQTASIPFDISAEFLPEMHRRPDERVERLTAGLPEDAPEFASILHKCTAMKECIARARTAAGRDVPVLLEGESGTGKELFARAIHEASPRREGQFIAVNCGAISQDLIESELFGHEKGAFTGASSKRAGHFETAKGGTIFLDEVGELPPRQQVKLLRVLQEKQITRVGSSSSIDVDVRIIAATHRNLPKAVTDGDFREDLFYRLAVAIIALPPLRQRPGDLNLLIDHLLADINDKCSDQPSWQDKKLSASARNILLNHDWPGNVRELLNTLTRAVIWSSGGKISGPEMEESLLRMPGRSTSSDGILGRSIEENFELQEVMGEVARHYLERALRESGGNKTKAAEMLGLGSYQTLTNWAEKYGLDK
jgi:transcriptional regulator with PAS, ATPase and Fis domain